MEQAGPGHVGQRDRSQNHATMCSPQMFLPIALNLASEPNALMFQFVAGISADGGRPFARSLLARIAHSCET
jgi:hypothetical protein